MWVGDLAAGTVQRLTDDDMSFRPEWTSNETGRYEVYVRQIPGPGPIARVSVDGGTEPMWSSDESTLFYRGPKRMMAATIAERPGLAVTRRDSLFVDTYRRYTPHSAYDVFPNGREFLMTRGASTTGSNLFVITNWQQMIAHAPRATP